MNSFTERMALGKEIAQDLRSRGRSIGALKGYAKRPLPTGLDAIEAYYNQYRKDIHYWAYTAVEEALFASELEDIRQWL
jgi:hypothetical protein